LVESLNDDVIYHRKEYVSDKYFVARRNVWPQLGRPQVVELVSKFLGEKVCREHQK
jgi:hypothetical protein